MKATALIAAAVLSFGTAAFAAQHDADKTARGEDNARAEQQEHGTAGSKLRNGLHRLGEKTRHAFHRAGDKSRQVAHRRDDNDTRAMGAAGEDHDRRSRMDSAYANWKAKHDKDENTSAKR